MIRKLLTGILILFFLALVIVPLLWILIASFKTNAEFFAHPFGLPSVWSLGNYVKAFSLEPLLLYLTNSITVAVVSTLLTVMVTALAAYVFLYQFPCKKWIYFLLIFGLFVPLSAFMLPYFLVVNGLGLYDTVWGLALVYAGVSMPLSFLIIHTYLKEIITQEVIEASYIDGASFFKVFSHIAAPLAKGGMITAAIFLLISSWNELLYALLLTQSEQSRTVQVAIRFFISSFAANYPLAFAAIVIAILPMIIIYIFFNNRIVSGLTLVNK
jgi:raffinose/stachyose/melibiose transport system permease protein